MAVRFNIKGEQVKDHSDLSGAGQRTHAEIDQYLEDIDESKGSFGTLKEKLDWIITHSSGGAGVQVGSYLYEVFKIVEPQDVINLEGSYIKGSNELEVYRGGLRMTIEDDYIEESEKSIKLTSPAENEIVVLRVKDRFGIVEPLGEHHEYFIVDNEITDEFILGSRFDVLGANLTVVLNGVNVAVGEDYIITSLNEVKFLEYVPKGSLVYFKIGDKSLNSEPTVLQHKFLTTDALEYQLDFRYAVGKNELSVFVGGSEYFVGIDYEETAIDKIRFFEGFVAGLPVLVCKENSGAFKGKHTHVFNDEPIGDVDGENASFNLKHIPLSGSVCIYYGGIRQHPKHYSVDRNVVTFNTPPPKNTELLADYLI